MSPGMRAIRGAGCMTGKSGCSVTQARTRNTISTRSSWPVSQMTRLMVGVR